MKHLSLQEVETLKEQVEKGQGADDSAEIEKLRKVVERGGAALRQSQEQKAMMEKEMQAKIDEERARAEALRDSTNKA